MKEANRMTQNQMILPHRRSRRFQEENWQTDGKKRRLEF
jgi:hypothetical protein